jgi:hypothetical protein
VRSASTPARRGAALGRVPQAFGKRPAEGHGHGDVEAAADHRQARRFAPCRRMPHTLARRSCQSQLPPGLKS